MALIAVHQTAIDLIKEFEGFVDHWYPDPATGGEPWTCCYGHTSAAGFPKYQKGQKFTQAEGETILKHDLEAVSDAVFKAVTMPVNAYQFGALVSLAFNIGMKNFRNSSLLKAVNAGDFKTAAAKFALYNRANKKVMAGLTRRRAAEAELFMRPIGNPVKPASPPPGSAKSPYGKPPSDSAGWIVIAAMSVAGAITGLVSGGWNWLVGLFS